jgi:hypothetical protein
MKVEMQNKQGYNNNHNHLLTRYLSTVNIMPVKKRRIRGQGVFITGAFFTALISATTFAVDCGCPPSGSYGSNWWAQYASWCRECGGTPDKNTERCIPGPNWGGRGSPARTAPSQPSYDRQAEQRRQEALRHQREAEEERRRQIEAEEERMREEAQRRQFEQDKQNALKMLKSGSGELGLKGISGGEPDLKGLSGGTMALKNAGEKEQSTPPPSLVSYLSSMKTSLEVVSMTEFLFIFHPSPHVRAETQKLLVEKTLQQITNAAATFALNTQLKRDSFKPMRWDTDAEKRAKKQEAERYSKKVETLRLQAHEEAKSKAQGLEESDLGVEKIRITPGPALSQLIKVGETGK